MVVLHIFQKRENKVCLNKKIYTYIFSIYFLFVSFNIPGAKTKNGILLPLNFSRSPPLLGRYATAFLLTMVQQIITDLNMAGVEEKIESNLSLDILNIVLKYVIFCNNNKHQ